MNPRRRALRWLLLLLSVPSLLALWIGSLFLRAHQILEFHRLETKAILETFPRADSERPAIFDPAEPGDAWALEVEVLRKLEENLPTDDPPALHRFVFSGITSTLEQGDTKAEQLEPDLDLLRKALRRTTVLPSKRPGWFTNCGMAELISTLRHSATLRHQEGNDLGAMERLALSWGLAQDLARHGDRSPHDKLWDAETRGALAAKAVLESHSLSSRELETVARWLDRLSKARPSLSRALEIDGALERSFIADPDSAPGIFISDALRAPEPTWRELWSSTLHDAKRVTTMARTTQSLRGIDALPIWERETAAIKKLEGIDPRICESWEVPDPLYFRLEARALTYLAMVRLAVAVAWYEVEHDAFPARLDALVPKYLSSLEPCPSNGRPFHHEKGLIWLEYAADPNADGGDDTVYSPSTAQWRIGRKPK